MKSTIKKIVWISLIALVGIQFVPTNRNESDNISPLAFSRVYEVPIEISRILKKSCYDCHSNNTNYPWYSNIQPGAWIMESHITEGKEELNFSEFDKYSKRRKRNKLKSIINELENDKMPLTSYTIIHRDAKLTEINKTEILERINGLITN